MTKLGSETWSPAQNTGIYTKLWISCNTIPSVNIQVLFKDWTKRQVLLYHFTWSTYWKYHQKQLAIKSSPVTSEFGGQIWKYKTPTRGSEGDGGLFGVQKSMFWSSGCQLSLLPLFVVWSCLCDRCPGVPQVSPGTTLSTSGGTHITNWETLLSV